MADWLGKDYIEHDSTIKVPIKVEELRCDICNTELFHREWEVTAKEWKLHNVRSKKAYRVSTATFESPELDEVKILMCENCYNHIFFDGFRGDK